MYWAPRMNEPMLFATVLVNLVHTRVSESQVQRITYYTKSNSKEV